MASNWKRSRGRIKADNMGQGEGLTVPLQSDAPEESDLWTVWQLFPLDDDQTCDFKDRVGDWVDVKLLYNSVKTVESELQLSWRRSYKWDVVGKATSCRRGLWALMSWGPKKMLIRCRKESHHPAEWASGRASGERGRHNVDGHKSWGQNIAVSVRSPAPSYTQTLSNHFRTLAIKWEVNILLKKSSCVRYSLRQYVSCMNIYMRMQH